MKTTKHFADSASETSQLHLRVRLGGKISHIDNQGDHATIVLNVRYDPAIAQSLQALSESMRQSLTPDSMIMFDTQIEQLMMRTQLIDALTSSVER